MFSLLELVLHLRQAVPLAQGRVGGSLQFTKETATQAGLDVPYIWCVPIMTTGGSVEADLRRQSRRQMVGLIIATESKKHGAKGEGVAPALTVSSVDQVIAQVEDAIMSWQPSAFVVDGCPSFESWVPVETSATNSRMWGILEYAFPFFHFHTGYGGRSALNLAAWEADNPMYKAASIQQLFLKYKVKDEEAALISPSIYTESIPIPLVVPATDEERVAHLVAAGRINMVPAVNAALDGLRGLEANSLAEITADPDLTELELEFRGRIDAQYV